MSAFEERYVVARRRREVVEKLTFIREVVAEVAFILAILMGLIGLACFLVIVGTAL